MDTTHAPALHDINQAIALHVNYLDEQKRQEQQDRLLEDAARQARCTEAMRQLTDFLMRTEFVIVPMAQWTVTENGYPPAYDYIFCLDFGDDDKAVYRDDDYSNFRQVSIRNLTSEQVQRSKPTRYWMAWHNTSQGIEFDRFVAAVTYAKTGRK